MTKPFDPLHLEWTHGLDSIAGGLGTAFAGGLAVFLIFIMPLLQQMCHPLSFFPSAFNITSDASKIGWGAVLLAGRRIVRCSHGLWSTGFQHRVSNVLELEALCTALRAFKRWIFGAPVHAVVDN